MAHAFVEASANAGADAVKFQTHIASAESTPAEQWRIPFSRQDASRFDYWRRMEFTEREWSGLREHANERGMAFLSSPFSLEAVELLCRVGVPAWKVASGEIVNTPMLEAMVRTGKPILVSTGMSGWDELDRTVEVLRSRGALFALFQCTSNYPCPPESIGLNVLTDLRNRYGCPVGLSDHSGTLFPSLAAVVLGAEMLEVHVTFSRDMFGPDVPASLTFAELSELVRGVRFLESALTNPVDKDTVADAMAPMRALFTKSVVPRRRIVAGTTIEPDDVTFKKPGTGIPVDAIDQVLGRRAKRDLGVDELISLDDLESR